MLYVTYALSCWGKRCWSLLYTYVIQAHATANIRTVLDTDNLHFSDEFLDFPVRADADIHADVLGFSARFRYDFPQDSAQNNLWRQEFRAENETQ